MWANARRARSARAVRPRERFHAGAPHRTEQRVGDRLLRHIAQRSLAQHEGTAPLALDGAHGLARRVPRHLAFGHHRGPECGAHRRLVERRRQPDPALGGVAIEVGDREEVGARERVRPFEPRAAPVAQQEARGLSVASHGDAVRIREGDESADVGERLGVVTRLAPEPAAERAGFLAHAIGARAIDVATLAAQGLDARAQVGIVLRGLAPQDVALGEKRGDLARERGFAACRARDHQVREPGRDAHRGHRAAVCRHATVRADRAQVGKECATLRERTGRRRIEPAQRGRLGHAGTGEFERERGEVRFEDLRHRAHRQRRLVALAPEPDAEARGDAARAAASLVGRCLRHARGLESCHAAPRRETRNAGESGVDHHAHVLQRDRRLGDRRRQHHAALRAAPPQHVVLFAEREPAVQQEHLGVRERGVVDEQATDPVDLGDPRQEDEQVAGRPRPGVADRGRDAEGGRLVRTRGPPLGRHGEGAALAHDHRRVAEQRGDRRGLQRRRHHDEPQVVAHQRARLEHEREAEVGREMPFVVLVEEHRGDAVERGIVLHHPRQDALGHHLHARARSHARLMAHPIADGLTRHLAEEPGHLGRRGARGDAARLQHEDPSPRRPRGVEQREREPCRLASPGRRDEHRGARPGERREHLGEDRIDREGGGAVERRHAGGKGRTWEHGKRGVRT